MYYRVAIQVQSSPPRPFQDGGKLIASPGPEMVSCYKSSSRVFNRLRENVTFRHFMPIGLEDVPASPSVQSTPGKPRRY